MRRALVVVAVLLLATVGACGGGDDEESVELAPNDEAGLTLTARNTEPLRARAPVTWTLEVRNAKAEPVVLTFSSAQKGDVALYQGSQERYRWSDGKVFTEAFSETSVAGGQTQTFELTGDTLRVAPGEYELVAVMSSGPAPAEFRKKVTVVG
jgi:hypothetical protein